MTEQALNYPPSKAESNLDYDLVIVGGGIVGATLASALKASGLKIGIIEAQPPEKASARRRAYALSLMSGRILEGIGVWDKILPHIGKFSKIRLSDGTHPQVVKFYTTDLATEYLGYVGDHQVILTALQEFIAECPNINWLCPAQLMSVDYQQSEATLTLKIAEKEHQIRTKLVIGADGARSQIRTSAGITTRGWKYWQSCVTFTIKHQAPQNDVAFERFWPTGPMGILPLPDNRCQIVWTAPHAQAKALQDLDEQEFLAKLDYHTGGQLGQLELVSDRYLFPVQLMQSDRYIKPRLALVGDAAHCCHPVGGQGLNLGIRDAAALAQILREAHQKGEDIGTLKVLQPYQNWRKRENLAILGVTDLLDRVFSNAWLPVVAVRRLGIWMICHLPFLKIFALQVMTGLKGKTPQLAEN
ncbi:Ubiquinone biosynthesis hydroxylase, UbiH/UbiF/VisC/COQ6 family [Gloeothece citriformis PCC 7424]|uniref:Ubiquinone biosynthesis hydroxylase, UbiH/UbiF/VisC/COQ6 family n=1 Tax=Gloeothece citriformis (strain PCC 7424) TaxID=65393 RepID=B7KH65_GLOC7|nr:FAD-dependent hydroxylase [Gloeothece citriformis]ACK69274.1 Ubiquinone biosynthesis hydroxylase, UbiH/UbiF/VisC/COQ6 family [Gloeothece citriformis PCC 7424]